MFVLPNQLRQLSSTLTGILGHTFGLKISMKYIFYTTVLSVLTVTCYILHDCIEYFDCQLCCF